MKDLLKKYNKAICHAKQSAVVWIWRGNELSNHSNHIESDSLGPVHLQIPVFWTCFTQILAAINSFICTKLCPSKYQAIFAFYFRIVHLWNTVMAVTSKKARRARSRFTLQFEVSHKESERLLYLGANRFFEGLFTGRKKHGTDGCSSYLQNEHKRVFIILWPLLRTAKFYLRVFLSRLMSPLYTCSAQNKAPLEITNRELYS